MNPYHTQVGFYPQSYYASPYGPGPYVGQMFSDIDPVKLAQILEEKRQRSETWTYVLAGAAIAGLGLLLLGRLR